MSHKSVGTKGERDIVRAFWSNGWVAIRTPGSGSARHPSPDIIAGKKERRVVIEAKITKEDKKYFTKEEIADLSLFADIFAAEAWVAIKFKDEKWLFVSLEDLEFSGGSYSISKEKAKFKGLLLEELVK